MTPYEVLSALVDEQLELVLDGRFADASALGSNVNELIESLPANPPREAGPELEAARAAVRSAIARTLAARDARLRELRLLRTGRDAMRTYRPERPGVVDQHG